VLRTCGGAGARDGCSSSGGSGVGIGWGGVGEQPPANSSAGRAIGRILDEMILLLGYLATPTTTEQGVCFCLCLCLCPCLRLRLYLFLCVGGVILQHPLCRAGGVSVYEVVSMSVSMSMSVLVCLSICEGGGTL